MPKLKNLTLEPPRLGMSYFVKRSIKKMMGFWRGAQIQESGSGAARARNELFCSAKYSENDRFRGGAQTEESGPGAARARNELFCEAKY